MLSANGDYQLPAGVIVNNFLNISMKGEGAEKMSKSRGTAVWINEYLQAGGDPDALRYYLTAVAPENGRTVFQPDELARRYESELADVLGNFAQRTLTLSRSCFGATIPEYSTGRMEASDREFLSLIERTHDHVTHDMENFAFKNALSRTMGFARECNRYFNERKPWVTRKTDIEATRVTMALSLQALKLIAVELWPFLPEAASKIGRMLSFDVEATGWHGATAALRKGDPLTEPVILFKKSGD